MADLDTTATTFEELTERINKIRKVWKFDKKDIGQPWFRGQQRKHWRLVPSIVRYGCFDTETEDEIREEFVLRAPALAGAQPMPQNDWDSYFLMQHFGAPTRLLDWTESILIALYFALRDNPGYYDSAIWMLDPYELNWRVLKERAILAPSALGVNPNEQKLAAPWLPIRWKHSSLPNDPIAIHPTHIAMRITNQKSCFTIHGKQEDGFDQFKMDSKNPCVAKIVIPSAAVSEMKLVLKQYGIEETTIFPDLQGLGRALVSTYASARQERAHSKVFVRLRPSKLHLSGVGVFAIRDIPAGTTIFAGENEEILWTKERSLPKSGELRKLYDDFAIIRDGQYGCPPSFNRLTPAWYMNESKKPNTRCDENYDFIALRKIARGEELTVDYATFSDYPEN